MILLYYIVFHTVFILYSLCKRKRTPARDETRWDKTWCTDHNMSQCCHNAVTMLSCEPLWTQQNLQDSPRDHENRGSIWKPSMNGALDRSGHSSTCSAVWLSPVSSLEPEFPMTKIVQSQTDKSFRLCPVQCFKIRQVRDVKWRKLQRKLQRKHRHVQNRSNICQVPLPRPSAFGHLWGSHPKHRGSIRLGVGSKSFLCSSSDCSSSVTCIWHLRCSWSWIHLVMCYVYTVYMVYAVYMVYMVYVHDIVCVLFHAAVLLWGVAFMNNSMLQLSTKGELRVDLIDRTHRSRSIQIDVSDCRWLLIVDLKDIERLQPTPEN